MKTAEGAMAGGAVERPERRGFARALADRLGLDALNYPVPAHANTIWYTLGGITLVGLLVMLVSGVLMALWYDPTPAGAGVSIRQMMNHPGAARLLRGVHYWTAQVVMVTIVLHLLRVIVTGAYKRRREINWLLGVGLLFTVFGFYYTGTVLKWDQEGYEALAHTSELAKGLGVLGVPLTAGFAKGIPVFERIMIGHVALLPLVFLALVFGHLLLVKVLGISALPGKPEAPPTAGALAAHDHTFLRHGKKLFGYALILIGIVLALGILLPPTIGRTPVEGIEVSKPPWAFIWLYPIEDRFGLNGLLVAPLVIVAGLVLLPFIDRGQETGLRRRWWVVTVAAAGLVAAVALGVAGHYAGLVSHVGM